MKNYFLDTNIIRYLSETSGNTAHGREWLNSSKIFLERALKEIEDGESSLRITKDVFRELELHSISFVKEGPKTRLHNQIEYLKGLSENISYREHSTETIHALRKLTQYTKTHYNNLLDKHGSQLRFERGGESDARILCTAYEYDGVVVTGNIKDFLICLVLGDFEYQENILYNIQNNEYIKLPDEVFKKIIKDEEFKKYKSEFVNALERE